MSASDRSAKKVEPSVLDAKIGANIRLFRKAAGLSQTELGDAVGLRFQQIQKYETGTNRVYASRLKEIADALNVSVLALYGDMTDKALERAALIPPSDMTMEEAQKLLSALDNMPEETRAHFVGLIAQFSQKTPV